MVILTKELTRWSPGCLFVGDSLAKIIVAPPIVKRRISETADGGAGDAGKAGRVVGDAAKVGRVAGDATAGVDDVPGEKSSANRTLEFSM